MLGGTRATQLRSHLYCGYSAVHRTTAGTFTSPVTYLPSPSYAHASHSLTPLPDPHPTLFLSGTYDDGCHVLGDMGLPPKARVELKEGITALVSNQLPFQTVDLLHSSTVTVSIISPADARFQPTSPQLFRPHPRLPSSALAPNSIQAY